MEFLQLDVFADAAYKGNPLAVFPDAADLSRAQMQAIASEMNLSETTFVTSTQRDSYDCHIFTPQEELPFAGHPTIGTAWALRHLGRVNDGELTQKSSGGTTIVRPTGDMLWLERAGTSEPDLDERDMRASERLARALGLKVGDVGLEARELGRSGRLRPAFADAGVRLLMVPVRDVAALGRCQPRRHLLDEITTTGCYCYAAAAAGRLRTRAFFPVAGITEDPATGIAAAALGAYLAKRLGSIDMEVMQGVEMGRPSRISLRADTDAVHVGGRCTLVLTGRLEQLP